jgi:hypothetical protein
MELLCGVIYCSGYFVIQCENNMADRRAFGLLLSLLLFCLVKHNVDLKYITNVKLFDVDLLSEDKVNSTANCGFIAIFHRINTPASTSLYFKRLGFLKRRLNYYANCTASYNPSIITMSQSGDIHPLPGPGQRENITHIRCL